MNTKIELRIWDRTVNKLIYEDNFLLFSSTGCLMLSPHYEENLYTKTTDPARFEITQFTGILDKFGIKIWEGDILLDEHRNQKYKVFRVPGGFAVNTHQDDFYKEKIIFYSGLSDMQNFSWAQSLKKIGDIYSNPELIKKQ